MTVRETLVLATLTLMCSEAGAETVRYEAYKFLPNGERQLIASGTREYSPAQDIQLVDPCRCGSTDDRNMRLVLFGAFGIEVDANGDPSRGFGVMVEEEGSKQSFSWNWFSPPARVPHWLDLLKGASTESSDIYTNGWQGGRVRVATRSVNGAIRLEAIEFLDDITLDYTDEMMRRPVGVKSHEFVIHKGSVVRFLKAVP